MLAGLAVGLLVGLTGMGAGSLMTPILITFFGIPAGTAVGTDLVYAAVTKTFGAARHHQLKNVNRELALWMATGSVPAAFLGTYSLYNSAFDRSFEAVSPGMVLVAEDIRIAIEAGCGAFDLLKGDYAYKYRFGAVPRAIKRLLVRR